MDAVMPSAETLLDPRVADRTIHGQGTSEREWRGWDGLPRLMPVSIDALEGSRGYDNRIGMVRGFTRDNPARAALAVRDMIKSDAR